MRGMAPPLRPWQAVVGRVVRALVSLVLWGIPGALLLTGLALWHDWHALARGGVEATALVERCEWKSVGSTKSHTASTGYYSCDYTYRTSPDGPVLQGYFQSQRERHAGDALPIRFLRDQPSTSAPVELLASPSLAPGAMIVVALLLFAWTARGRRRAATAR